MTNRYRSLKRTSERKNKQKEDDSIVLSLFNFSEIRMAKLVYQCKKREEINALSEEWQINCEESHEKQSCIQI